MKLVNVTSSMLHGKIKQCPPAPPPPKKKQSNKYMCMNYNRTFLTAVPWQYPLLAPSVRWPQMVWCVCVDGMNLKYALRWHIHIYIYVSYIYMISSFRTMSGYTNTCILRPFEDHEPTVLKVDITGSLHMYPKCSNIKALLLKAGSPNIQSLHRFLLIMCKYKNQPPQSSLWQRLGKLVRWECPESWHSQYQRWIWWYQGPILTLLPSSNSQLSATYMDQAG